MKKTSFYLVAMLMVGLISCNNSNVSLPSSKTNTPEAFSEVLITSLSKKDFAGFSTLTLTKAEAEELLNHSYEGTLEKKEKELLKLDNETKEMLSESKKSFDETIKEIEDDGVILSEIKYKTCDYETKKEKGILAMGITIKFDYKGNIYEVKLKSVVMAGENWRSTGRMHYQLSEEKKALMEDRAKSIADSIAVALEQSLKEASESH